jgi:SRSO17 transposase
VEIEASHHASLLVAWRLYLPESWANDAERREASGIPAAVRFQTKPLIALEQIRQAVEQGVPVAPVLADTAYGHDTRFREGVTALNLRYLVGVQENTTVWRTGEAPRLKKRRTGAAQFEKRGAPSRSGRLRQWKNSTSGRMPPLTSVQTPQRSW